MSTGYIVDPEELKKLSDEQLERVKAAWAMEKARVIKDYGWCCTNMREVISEITDRKVKLLDDL